MAKAWDTAHCFFSIQHYLHTERLAEWKWPTISIIIQYRQRGFCVCQVIILGIFHWQNLLKLWFMQFFTPILPTINYEQYMLKILPTNIKKNKNKTSSICLDLSLAKSTQSDYLCLSWHGLRSKLQWDIDHLTASRIMASQTEDYKKLNQYLADR